LSFTVVDVLVVVATAVLGGLVEAADVFPVTAGVLTQWWLFRELLALLLQLLQLLRLHLLSCDDECWLAFYECLVLKKLRSSRLV
jgi:hypothetical protein